jgi:hypothetical protein
MPAPELEPLSLVVVVIVAAGRSFVPTSRIRSTGCFVTFEEISLLDTTLPSTTVVRTVTTRSPSAPARETFVWSV